MKRRSGWHKAHSISLGSRVRDGLRPGDDVRRAAKRDASEKAIVDALRKAGWSVEFLNLKDGPDLLIGRWGRTHVAEIKTGKRKLRPGQEQWHREWRGSDVLVFRSAEDAIAFNEFGLELANNYGIREV